MAGIGDRMSGENGIVFRDGFPIDVPGSPARLEDRTTRRGCPVGGGRRGEL